MGIPVGHPDLPYDPNEKALKIPPAEKDNSLSHITYSIDRLKTFYKIPRRSFRIKEPRAVRRLGESGRCSSERAVGAAFYRARMRSSRLFAMSSV